MPPSDPQEFVPGWSVHPGFILRQILDKRGIRQAELAERTGLTPKHVNQIVKEGVGISGDVAVLLERALDVRAEFWTRLDADYEAQVSKERAKDRLPDFYAWANSFDAPTLERHGIIAPADDQDTRVEKVLRFFRVATPEAFERTWLQPRVSFRRSQAFTVAEHNTALWLRLVERCAESVSVLPFRVGALRKVARTLPAMTNLTIPDGFIAARAALAEAGVALTFVRQVPGTRVCGATWWLGSERPVIGLTERNRKPDIFWFSLVHEIGHLLLHPRRTTFLDLEDEKKLDDPAEREANEFAEETLLPAGTAERIARATTREELLLLATGLRIGVTIVAGQHGHATGRWKVGGSLRGKITDMDLLALERMCPTGP